MALMSASYKLSPFLFHFLLAIGWFLSACQSSNKPSPDIVRQAQHLLSQADSMVKATTGKSDCLEEQLVLNGKVLKDNRLATDQLSKAYDLIKDLELSKAGNKAQRITLMSVSDTQSVILGWQKDQESTQLSVTFTSNSMTINKLSLHNYWIGRDSVTKQIKVTRIVNGPKMASITWRHQQTPQFASAQVVEARYRPCQPAK